MSVSGRKMVLNTSATLKKYVQLNKFDSKLNELGPEPGALYEFLGWYHLSEYLFSQQIELLP